MPKLTIADLTRIREDTKKSMARREEEAAVIVTVHMGECGIDAGAREVMKALLEEIAYSGREDIWAMNADCLEMCDYEPIVEVAVAGEKPVLYQHMDKEKIKQVFKGHVLQGEVQHEFTLVQGTGQG
jgi:NADP-reducing hydrogenase subunit HndB